MIDVDSELLWPDDTDPLIPTKGTRADAPKLELCPVDIPCDDPVDIPLFTDADTPLFIEAPRFADTPRLALMFWPTEALFPIDTPSLVLYPALWLRPAEWLRLDDDPQFAFVLLPTLCA